MTTQVQVIHQMIDIIIEDLPEVLVDAVPEHEYELHLAGFEKSW